MIHTKPFAVFGEEVNWFISNTLFNLAVPFFFLVSGFLFFTKISKCESVEQKNLVFKKYALHVLKMYLIYSCIWLPLKILGYVTSTGFGTASIIDYVKSFFLTGKTGDAMWYLHALLLSTVIAFLVARNNLKNLKILTIVAGFFYVAGVIFTSCYQMVKNPFIDWYFSVFSNTDNFIFNGLLFFCLGALIGVYPIKPTKNSILITLLFVSFIAMVVEAILVYEYKTSYFDKFGSLSLPIVSVILFVIVKNISLNGNDNVYLRLRDYSTLIYLSHCLILRSLNIIFGVMRLTINYVLLFIVTMFFSLLYSELIRYLGKKKQIKFFKLFY